MVPFAFKVATTQSLSQSKVNIHKFWVLRHEHFCKAIFLPTIVYILELIQFYPTCKRKSPHSDISKGLYQL